MGAPATDDASRGRFDRIIDRYRNLAARHAGTDPTAASAYLGLATRLAAALKPVPDVHASSRQTKQHRWTDLDLDDIRARLDALEARDIRDRLAALEARLPGDSSRKSDSPGTTRSE